MSAAYKIPQLAVLLLALVLTSCASQPTRRPPPPAPVPAPAEQPTPTQVEAREFRVDTVDSLLTIQVYKGGPLSRAGHNHVIASHSMKGVVYVPEDLTRAGFDIRIPVNDLVVDEEDLRAEAGPDFPPKVPEDARVGTKRNMLSAALLDVDRYPEIALQSEAIQRGPQGLEVQVRMIVRDRATSVVVPVQYEIRGDFLRVLGETALKQTDLGLTPFSLFGGALRVEDEIKVKFRIVARAAAPAPPAEPPSRP